MTYRMQQIESNMLKLYDNDVMVDTVKSTTQVAESFHSLAPGFIGTEGSSV